MSHFAKIIDGIVVQTIAAKQDVVEAREGTWIQTSYNTQGNKHLLGGTPLRGNYAGIGHIYDAVNDVFYAPQPFASWTLNNNTWSWEPPTPRPTDKPYKWDEATLSWIEL